MTGALKVMILNSLSNIKKKFGLKSQNYLLFTSYISSNFAKICTPFAIEKL
jgi:hypothetical protein